jgi:hypothetical protein
MGSRHRGTFSHRGAPPARSLSQDEVKRMLLPGSTFSHRGVRAARFLSNKKLSMTLPAQPQFHSRGSAASPVGTQDEVLVLSLSKHELVEA